MSDAEWDDWCYMKLRMESAEKALGALKKRIRHEASEAKLALEEGNYTSHAMFRVDKILEALDMPHENL